MSNEKLSELSKPVAYVFDHGVMGPSDFSYGTPQMHSTAKDENARPLYSQEYVSVLLAELESYKQYAKERDAENESLALTVGRLRAKLATPVRLPVPSSELDLNEFAAEWRDCGIAESATALREQGFTVGDE
jgi:hypothetical protein